MTRTSREEAGLLERLTNTETLSSPPSSDITNDEGMPSDLDEKVPLAFDIQGALPKKPLIDYITNEWQRDPKYREDHEFRPPGRADAYPGSRLDDFLDAVDDCCEGLWLVVKSPTFRRVVFFLVTAIACFLWTWFSVVRPHIRETQAALATFADLQPTEGLYGHNKRPNFPDMIQLKSLDPGLLPVDGKSRIHRSRWRRLIFVGDIHGCTDELVALLEKVKFNPKHDHLVTTGDMIDKGPDSLGVVNLLREMNASCVRGNHEDRVLLTRGSLQHTLRAGLEEEFKSPREDDAERALARSLSDEQAAYLQSCPVILRVGELGSFSGEVVVVHAGLVPGVPLENQDPISVMTMRIIDLETHMPSRDHDRTNSIPWERMWNKIQNLIPDVPSPRARFGPAAPHLQQKKIVPRTSVIYGHDSRRGLQFNRWTRGLDTGCVKGGKLSALVLGGGKQNLVQVSCKNYVKANSPGPAASG